MILAITFTFQNLTHISNCFGQLLIWYICKDRSPQPSRKAVWICPPSTLPRESIEFPECIRSIVCLSLVVCLSCFSDNFQTSIIWEETMKILNKWKVSYSYKSFLLDMIFTTDDVMIQNSQSVIPDQKSPCFFFESSGQVRQIDGLSSASIVMRKTLEELELNVEGAVGGKLSSRLGCNKSAKPTILLMEDIRPTSWYGKYHRFYRVLVQDFVHQP